MILEELDNLELLDESGSKDEIHMVFSLCGGQVFDTPGFSSLEFASFKEEDIRDAFREFKKFPCEYKDCMHINEKECLVKKAVNAGKILKERYDNYLSLIKKR